MCFSQTLLYNILSTFLWRFDVLNLLQEWMASFRIHRPFDASQIMHIVITSFTKSSVSNKGAQHITAVIPVYVAILSPRLL